MIVSLISAGVCLSLQKSLVMSPSMTKAMPSSKGPKRSTKTPEPLVQFTLIRTGPVPVEKTLPLHRVGTLFDIIARSARGLEAQYRTKERREEWEEGRGGRKADENMRLQLQLHTTSLTL